MGAGGRGEAEPRDSGQPQLAPQVHWGERKAGVGASPAMQGRLAPGAGAQHGASQELPEGTLISWRGQLLADIQCRTSRQAQGRWRSRQGVTYFGSSLTVRTNVGMVFPTGRSHQTARNRVGKPPPQRAR